MLSLHVLGVYVCIVHTMYVKCTVIFSWMLNTDLTVVFGAPAKYNYEPPGEGPV